MRILPLLIFVWALGGCRGPQAPSSEFSKRGARSDFQLPTELGAVTVGPFFDCAPELHGDGVSLNRAGHHPLQWGSGCMRCPDGSFAMFSRTIAVAAVCSEARASAGMETCPILGDALLAALNDELTARQLPAQGFGLGCLSWDRPQVTISDYRELSAVVTLAADLLNRWDATGPLDILVADLPQVTYSSTGSTR